MRYKFSGIFRDGSGNVVSSGSITVYLSGTNTLADIYTTADGSTAVNSTTTSTDGSFSFYVDEGDYYSDHTRKLVLSKTGFTSKTYDYYEPTGFYLVDYTDATITYALSKIGTSTKATLLIRPGTWTISTNVNWSAYANVTFKFANGATISHSTYTLVIPNMSGDPLFTGTGLVTITNIEKVIPQWFGAKGDFSTDDTSAIQAAINATDGKIPFYFPPGGYVISSSLLFSKNSTGRALTGTIISGAGTSSVIINNAPANNPTFKDTGTVRGLVMKDLSFVGKTSKPNRGIQFNIIESSHLTNLSLDMYGDGIYVVEHAMDLKIDHSYFWWDRYSDILGYTTSIRHESLVQGFSAIKICNEEYTTDYWANHILIDNIWTNGGKYGVNITSEASNQIRITNSSFDAWAASDGSKFGHDVPIRLSKTWRSVIRDCYLNSNAETATNRLVVLSNTKDILLENIRDDAYSPSFSTSVPTSAIQIDGSASDNIVIRDVQSAGGIDIHADVNAYATITLENARFIGGFTTANRYPSYMSQFYARNLYIKTEGYSGSGSGYVDTSMIQQYTLSNSATPDINAANQLNNVTFLSGGTTTITDIIGGRTGQLITILANHTITITSNADIYLKGSVSLQLVSGDSISFCKKDDGSWYEISRSYNGTIIKSTTSDLASAASAINTTNKALGKKVWDSTISRYVFASGAGASDTWKNESGEVEHSPL